MTTAILFGYYGFGNTGDEQLLDTSIRIIKELPISINYVVANGPRSTPFSSFNRWNIIHWVMHLNQSSYLIFGGGSVFQSGTSCRSLMFYLFIVLLARLFGCKVILLCHGWGPFRSQWHQSIARIILKDAYRSWRLRMDDPQFDQDATFCDLTLTEPIDNCKKPQLNCIGVALRHAFDEKKLQEKLAISEPIVSINNDDHPKNKGVYLADIWDANSTSVSILITDRFHSAVWAIRHSIFGLVFQEILN